MPKSGRSGGKGERVKRYVVVKQKGPVRASLPKPSSRSREAPVNGGRIGVSDGAQAVRYKVVKAGVVKPASRPACLSCLYGTPSGPEVPWGGEGHLHGSTLYEYGKELF